MSLIAGHFLKNVNSRWINDHEKNIFRAIPPKKCESFLFVATNKSQVRQVPTPRVTSTYLCVAGPPTMREQVEVADMRAASPMIMSPTGLTNAIRRDKSPGRAQGPTSFLAAEHFQEIGAPVGRSRSYGTVEQQYVIPVVETVEEEESARDEGSFEGCKAPLMRRPKSCTEVKDVAFEVKEVAMSTPVRTAVKVQYVLPAQEKTKQMVEQAKIKAQQAQQKAKEMKPGEEQVRGCFRETRATGDKMSRYANLVYDMFAQECVPNAVRGDPHGDDAVFFRYGSPTRSSPDGSKSRPFSPESNTPSSPDDAFRTSKSMRYPQAAKIENPVERSERKKNRDRESQDRIRDSSTEETREDTSDSLEDSFDLGNVMNKGDDQVSLREVRLQMYKVDDGQKSVPRARLSRALGELSLQDNTIESLQVKLEDTKLLLREEEKRLADAETLCRKHERKIQELMAKASDERRTLEAKIGREAQAKGQLQSRVDVLQKEIYRLKAALGEESTGAATLASIAKGDLKRADSQESGTDGEVWEGILSEDDENTAAEVSLRAEIVSLKSQLADSHAEIVTQRSADNSRLSSQGSKASTASRGLYMSSETSDEMSQLRQKLEAAEAELAALKGSQQQSRDASEKIVALQQKLKTAEGELLESTQQLEEVKARESNLFTELEDAKNTIVELESELAASQQDSLEEAEDLRLLYKDDSKESEVAKNRALSELEQSRTEVGELKAEVKRLTETIDEMNQNAVALTEERLKERDRLEEALHRCKDTEHQLRDQIIDLEERLEKAQASTLQLVDVSGTADESRSVKRKLDESMDSETGVLVTRESFQQEERVELKEQLKRSQAVEEHLRSEMAITRELLHCAEKVVAEMESEMKEDSRQRSDHESRLLNELNDLRKRLEESEQKNREAIAARDKDAEKHSKTEEALKQSEAKQQALLNQIKVLKVALESVEIERQQEKMEVADERRIHEDLESRRIKEIDVLRVELANTRAKAEKSSALQAEVDELRVRLANAQVQAEEVKRVATKEGQKKDEVSKKLQSEMSAVKQRLATIRKRNATRRQRQTSYETNKTDSSSTDDLSTSGESVQSFGFSQPEFSSPERRTVTSATASSPSSITRSSPYSSPRSSPQRPLGSFPSPPRRRVDVSILRQRLLESNQRLQDANTQLSGLEKSSDSMVQEQSRAENLGDEIMTLVEQHSDSSRSPDRSFHNKIQVRVTESQPSTVHWPEAEEGSI